VRSTDLAETPVPLKLAVPDLISNSYFPAVAAVDLGLFAREGLDVELELIFPLHRCWEALRDGAIDFVGASSHSAVSAFPAWNGVKLLGGLGQGMYWFLVMRSDIGARRGDLSCVRGRTIGAAGWVDLGLRGLLHAAGIDADAEGVTIAPVPGAAGAGVNFGLTAAKALQERTIDGFWANGMAAEVAVRGGYGTLVLDVRRGDGPPEAFDYTMASLATTDALIARDPETAAGALRAIVATHAALRADPSLATQVGEKRFPAHEASLIRTLVERDLPFYDTTISPAFVAGMKRFARERGVLDGDPAYDAIVATRFSSLWSR
jgi:ABC-type nitrate/sulfonate/bicarbonate transport system substrate-binding protein